MTLPFPPISDADWPPDIADLLDDFAGKLNVYRVMAHNPALVRAISDLRGHIVLGGALTEQQREIVVLRTGWHWRSDYEWAHHVWRGKRVGLSDARIERTRGTPASWSDEDEDEDILLLRSVDRLLSCGSLDRMELAKLLAIMNVQGVTDLMATIGYYTTLAFLLRSFETPIDAFVIDQEIS